MSNPTETRAAADSRGPSVGSSSPVRPAARSTASGFWLPVATLWQRELVRFWRQKSRVLGVVASPLVFWLLIGYGSGDLARFFAGALVLTVLFSAIFSTISIIEDRREGFLLSMLVSPAPRTSLVFGKILGSATLAWIQGLIFLAFAPLAGVSLTVTEVLE
ncbi:MAG: ABC transporter permease, partial [Bryobacteraceae bacterium]